MSKGFCKDDERRIDREESTGVIGIDDLIGAKVQVISLTMGTTPGWKSHKERLFTIEDIKFRVQIDGKCNTLFYLKECPNRVFTVKDLILVG